MDFTSDKPIYRQIMERMGEKILRGEWREGERIPAVREFAMQLQVNPNTVMRAYESLQSSGVIFNRRGIGFFVSESARARILEARREIFLMVELPGIFGRMDMLGIEPGDIMKRYDNYKKHGKDENEQ